MAEFLPIMLALCSMLLYTQYAKNYAGVTDAGLAYTMVRTSTILAYLRIYQYMR